MDKAAAFVEAQGKEKALAEISTAKGQFDKGEIYVFAYDPGLSSPTRRIPS